MKNTAKLMGIASILFMASCGENKVQETETTTTPAASTETTIIKTETKETPQTKTTTETKSTEFKVDKDGGTIETKDGENGTKIEVNKDKAGVIIKR